MGGAAGGLLPCSHWVQARTPKNNASYSSYSQLPRWFLLPFLYTSYTPAPLNKDLFFQATSISWSTSHPRWVHGTRGSLRSIPRLWRSLTLKSKGRPFILWALAPLTYHLYLCTVRLHLLLSSHFVSLIYLVWEVATIGPYKSSLVSTQSNRYSHFELVGLLVFQHCCCLIYLVNYLSPFLFMSLR